MRSRQFRNGTLPAPPDWQVGHIVIEAITPSVDGGRYPAKQIAGEPCVVEADIFRDGHQVVRAAVEWKRKDEEGVVEAPMVALDNDRWRGEFVPPENARYVFTIAAWTDLFATWSSDFIKKAQAGRRVFSDLREGIALLERMVRTARDRDAELLRDCVRRLRASSNETAALEVLSHPELAEVTARSGERAGLTRFDPPLELVADRLRARFGAWYEMFVRSQGAAADRSGTL